MGFTTCVECTDIYMTCIHWKEGKRDMLRKHQGVGVGGGCALPTRSAKLKLLDTTQEGRVSQGLLLDILSDIVLHATPFWGRMHSVTGSVIVLNMVLL